MAKILPQQPYEVEVDDIGHSWILENGVRIKTETDDFVNASIRTARHTAEIYNFIYNSTGLFVSDPDFQQKVAEFYIERAKNG